MIINMWLFYWRGKKPLKLIDMFLSNTPFSQNSKRFHPFSIKQLELLILIQDTSSAWDYLDDKHLYIFYELKLTSNLY